MTSTDIYSKLDSLDQQSNAGGDPYYDYGQSSGGVPNSPSIVAQDIPWAPASTQQEIAGRLNLWSTAAPALTPEMLLNFAEQGVSPTDPVGQWVIRTAVPALGSRKPIGQNVTEADAAARVLSAPGILFQLAQLPLDKMTTALQQTAANVGTMDDPTLSRYLSTGIPNVHHGFFNRLGDALTTGTRGALTGASAGLEAVEGAFRARVAEGSLDPTAAAAKGGLSVSGQRQAAAEAFTPRYGTTLETGTGGTLKFGSPSQTNDILGQTTLGQALRGNDLGGGFFPAGAAHEKAVLAQQAAASINGHALTPGRALASSVFQPGSRPYAIMSGIVDGAVAMKADPSAVVLNELSDVAKASRLFSPTSDAAILSTSLHLVDVADSSEKMSALRAWAGNGENLTEAMADKLRTDPGSLQQLVDQGIATHSQIANAIAAPHAGMFSGLRQAVSSKTSLEWLNNPVGRRWAEKQADSGFTDILLSNKGMPADVAARLARADTPDAVRSVVGQELGTTIRGVPTSVLPYAVTRPFQSLRMVQLMPRDFIGTEDVDNAVAQARRYLSLASVPRSEWDGILQPIAEADSNGARYDAFVNGVYGRVQTSIEEHLNVPDLQARMKALKADEIVPGSKVEGQINNLSDRIANLKTLARAHTRAWADVTAEDRQRWVEQVAGGSKIPGGMLDGSDLPIDGPHRASELFNTAIPALPNPRDIRHLTAAWAPLYENGVINKSMAGYAHFNDWLTGMFKVGALAKLALPVRFLFDEQARMASAGYDSMFKHPLSYLAWAIGDKGSESALGQDWAQMLSDRTSSYARAIGQSSRNRVGIFEPDRILSSHWTTYDKQDPRYVTAWADNLSAAHADGATREVARALRDPENYAPAGIVDKAGIDAVKEWFSNGAGLKFRNDLADAHLWGGESARLATDRLFADQYIDSLAQRLGEETGSHDALIAAVADGTPFKAPGYIDKDFVKQLRQLANRENPDTGVIGLGPNTVRAPISVTTGRAHVLSNVVDRMFSTLMDKPSGEFTRSPFFRQAYYNDMQRLLPHMDSETQDILIQRASEDGVNLLKPTTATGMLNLQKADKIAQANALGEAKRLLYYHAEKSNAADALRAVYPFANAMKSVVSSWAKLMVENPVAIRRVQQGVTAARESGFFYNDPADGTEKFNLIPGDIMAHLAGVPFPLAAPVKGLNIIGTGLPGVGPAVQIPAAMFMPHDNPVTNGLRNLLLPYGDPDYSGGTFETLFPGWLDKLKTSGYLGSWPIVGQTGNQARILQNLAHQVFQYKMSSGSYDISHPEVLNRLTKDSMADAQKLYLYRGLAQFAAPAAPNVIPQSGTTGVPAATMQTEHLKDGALIETWKLSNDYQQMLQAHGDSYSATLDFINKWGPNRLFATEPAARRVVFGVPTTEEAAIFRNEHSDFVKVAPTTYGYWAPQTGTRDYQAYLDAIKRGDLEPLTVDKWARLADARLGNSIYDQARQKMPASPTVDQRNWLDNVKAQITKQYPGFNDDSLKASRKTLPQTVDELRQAITDPVAKGTPLAEAVDTYIKARDQVLAKQAEFNNGRQATSVSSSARMEQLRTWLYQVGNAIAMQRPDFTNIWNNLFMFEVQPVTAAADLTAPAVDQTPQIGP